MTASADQAPDLTQTSLDDLMNVRVTSVSKKAQSLSQTGSAAYVITRDDIRRSGSTNIPDLLRMVPGVNVARINANTWAISIRGFNYRYSSKVLVMIDGRTVYSPGFSGVYWDQQMMPLEDIDRIEVIRGPGGSVWGANAMNGVINIISRSADDTRGGLFSAVVGSQDRAQGVLQYGGSAGPRGAYRVYGRYTMNEDSPIQPGNPASDSAHNIQGGFRSDWNLSAEDKLTVQGDILGSSEHQTIYTLFDNRLPNMYTLTDPVQVGSGNLLGRWNHVFSNGSETTLQMYYDRFRRYDQALNVLSTGDFDFQYHFHAGARNDIVTGVGYRIADQSYTDGYEITFGSGHRRDHLFSTFIQDEIKLNRSLSLTLGSKLEHNSYTGVEFEPSIRLVWLPTTHQTLWASASRAIQQPSWLIAESQLDIQNVPVPGAGGPGSNDGFGIIHLSGNPLLPAPVLFDYELGYRTEVSKQLTLDTSVFFSDYHRLDTMEPQAPYFTPDPAPPHLVIPSIYQAFGKAHDYGVEFSARWNAMKWWRLSPGFSFLQMDVSQDSRSADPGFAATPGDSPKHQAQLRSNITLPHHVDWDVSAFYVGALAGGSTAAAPVQAYTRVDSRIGWHLGESAEFSITGQNLLRPRHLEFLDGLQVIPSQSARAIVARVIWAF
jgi:iron complex outermembrane receptor protein